MKGFLLGLLCASLVFGAYLTRATWMARFFPEAPSAPVVADKKLDAGAPSRSKKKRRSRGVVAERRSDSARTGDPGREGLATTGVVAADDEPEPIKLSAADLKNVGQGDDLSKPDVLRLDMSDDKQARELDQDDIDARFRPVEGEIIGCIGSARPDPETYIPGKVTVKFKIQRSGQVSAVRVEGPAILQKGGLYGCIRGVVGRLRFPVSGSGQIVTYPFSLS